jgi:uncharacterized protein (TIGR00730 family)
MRSLCIFCGSSPGLDPAYRDGAIAMGQAIARRGLTLVYGGGAVGLMGVVADAALQAGGAVHGVIPEALMRKEVGHAGLTRLDVVDSMHTRKARMAELSDGFVALPGGIGTFEEIFEIWTWGQLGIHEKPLGFLNVAGFYDGLAGFLDHATAQGFMRPGHRAMAAMATEPDALIDALAAWRPKEQAKWLSPAES